MLKCLTVTIGALCFPMALFAADDYTKVGDWQGLLSQNGCVIWSVAVSEPNAQIHFRYDDQTGVRLDLGAAAWHDTGTTFEAGSDGFAEAFIFDVPPENMVKIDVIPAGHSASLVETHRPAQLQQVKSFLAHTAISEGDFGIVDNNDVPHGRFSTKGFLSMMKKFEACIAVQSS